MIIDQYFMRIFFITTGILTGISLSNAQLGLLVQSANTNSVSIQCASAGENYDVWLDNIKVFSGTVPWTYYSENLSPNSTYNFSYYRKNADNTYTGETVVVRTSPTKHDILLNNAITPSGDSRLIKNSGTGSFYSSRSGVCIFNRVWSEEQTKKEIDTASALGFKVVRMDLYMNEFLAKGSVFTGNHPAERIVQYAASKGMGVLWALNNWEENKYAPPLSDAQKISWQNFVQAVANQWKNNGNVRMECWNEANYDFFWGGNPNAQQYNQLLYYTHTGIMKNPTKKSWASGGLLTNDWDFLNLEKYITDAFSTTPTTFNSVTIHPYRFQTTGHPEDREVEYNTTKTQLKFLFSKRLINPQIWDTEIGYPCTLFNEYGFPVVKKAPYVRTKVAYTPASMTTIMVKKTKLKNAKPFSISV
jgi:hypothetical protein